MISAQIIADSTGPNGFNRLTTFVLVFPRIVLAEFNTHRMISKNSASSRAIPFKKMVEMVKENPFIPLRFQADHKGMQGNTYLEGDHDFAARNRWLIARDMAVSQASSIHDELNVTKQLCNRLLEPFMYHTVIATGSEEGWENFFALRAHEAAEIHIADLAYKMLDAYNANKPKVLERGEWHIPFGDKFDTARLEAMNDGPQSHAFKEELKVKIATARCARVSYMNFEGKDDYAADIKLHDTLLAQGHMSPLEHCAQYGDHTGYVTGNFGVTWKQYRKTFKGENKSEPRVMRSYDKA